MNRLLKLLITSTLLISPIAKAEIAVIVNASNTSQIDTKTISRIFLGKMKSFPDGGQAVPMNQASGSTATEEFNNKVLKKSSSQLKAYWSKLVFTGKGTPPKDVGGDAEMLKLISANPNLIGYVDAASVDGSVKVIATF